MSRRCERRYLLTTATLFVLGAQAGCSLASTDNAANDAAAVDALNLWWKQATYTTPVTAGNEDEAEDARWAQHLRAVVQGFRVKGQTVTVLTRLSGAEPLHPSFDLPGAALASDSQDLCRMLGGFVWRSDNRHFGLENIEVKGAAGQQLSSRIGINGTVQ